MYSKSDSNKSSGYKLICLKFSIFPYLINNSLFGSSFSLLNNSILVFNFSKISGL